MNHSHFRRFQSPTFNCGLCGRLTRDVGKGNADWCGQCFDIMSLDNEANDGGYKKGSPELKRVQAKAEKLLAKVAERGGDVAAVRKFCSFVFPATR